MADTGDHSTDYRLLAQQAIINFQFLEEAIRMYIEATYWIIHKKVEGEIPIKLSRKNIESWSLGRLLKEFQKFNSNTALISRIEKIVKLRNFCAHEAFLLRHDEFDDVSVAENRVNKMKQIVADSRECLWGAFAELRNITAIAKRLGWPREEPYISQ